MRLYRGTEGLVYAHNDGGVRAGDKDLRRVGAAQVQAAAGGGAIGLESWERGRNGVRGCAHNDGVVRLRRRALSIVGDSSLKAFVDGNLRGLCGDPSCVL